MGQGQGDRDGGGQGEGGGLTSGAIKEDLVVESQTQLRHPRQVDAHLHRAHYLTAQHVTIRAHLHRHAQVPETCTYISFAAKYGQSISFLQPMLFNRRPPIFAI